jgi:hypothetical protein
MCSEEKRYIGKSAIGEAAMREKQERDFSRDSVSFTSYIICSIFGPILAHGGLIQVFFSYPALRERLCNSIFIWKAVKVETRLKKPILYNSL